MGAKRQPKGTIAFGRNILDLAVAWSLTEKKG